MSQYVQEIVALTAVAAAAVALAVHLVRRAAGRPGIAGRCPGCDRGCTADSPDRCGTFEGEEAASPAERSS